MKSLNTLLRLARRDLDLLQRMLADQIDKATHTEERIRTHEQAIISEQQAALKDYEAHRAYGGYAALAIAGRKALHAELQAIEAEIERIRTVITEAYVEVRKFERLLELHEERERAAAQKRDDAELDELATLRAARVSRD